MYTVHAFGNIRGHQFETFAVVANPDIDSPELAAKEIGGHIHSFPGLYPWLSVEGQLSIYDMFEDYTGHESSLEIAIDPEVQVIEKIVHTIRLR